MTINILTLRYFHAVAKAGNVSRAAGRLNVAQSAVSRQILQLEQELGVPLLLRHRMGVELTEAGQLVMERAEEILRLSSDLPREVTEYSNASATGSVRLGFPPSLGLLIVAPVIEAVIVQHPDARIHLFAGLSQEVVARLEEDHLDLAITSTIDENRELRHEPLFSEEIWLVGRSPQWPFGDKPISPDQLSGTNLIASVGTWRRIHDWLARRCADLGRVIEADDPHVMMHMLHNDLGFVIMPRSGIEPYIGDDGYRSAPLDGFHLTRYLAEMKSRPKSALMRVVIEAIHDRVAEVGRDDRHPIRIVA